MIWFFDRAGVRLRYEIKRKANSDGYELVLTHPDGRTEREVIANPSRLLDRCTEVGSSLKEEGWRVG